MEIHHEIISMVILLLLIQEGLLSFIIESMCTEYWLATLSKHAQEKSVVRLTDCLGMTRLSSAHQQKSREKVLEKVVKK